MEIRDYMLPYGQQWIDEDDIEAVVHTLKSEFLTQGPRVKEFEEEIAKAVGAKYAAAISNGTAALHAACFAAGIGPGNEVVTSPITFAASANCALFLGAKPVFADIDPKTYNIDPESIKMKITDKTKAIIPVHFTGQPCNMDAIMDIAKEFNLVVIEDGAHALGAEYTGKRIGSIGDMTTLSFHPVKHITTGEGGAIATDSKELYERLILFRSHGITREANKLTKNEGPWYYEQQELGYNYRITDIQAALGISQLRKLDFYIKRRREIVERYNNAFKDCDALTAPYQESTGSSSWHLYIVQFAVQKMKVGRREIFEELRKRNIGVNVHYIPVYYHPYYQRLGYTKGICPNAEKLYEKIITLPLFPKMNNEDVEYVIKNVIDIVNKYKIS